jgi:hypothetical protein
VGDKSCDVYLYSLRSESLSEGRLLLGHVSLLLDMQLSADQQFLATCDRDEKIRISQFPSAHQIQSYCLGHREFVTSCVFVDHERLVSSSGDGSVACWDFRSGRALFVRQVSDDIESAPSDGVTARVVINRVFRLDDGLIAVNVAFPAQLLLYSLTDKSFEFKHRLPIESDVIDLVQQQSRLWLVTRHNGIRVVQHSESALHLGPDRVQLEEHELGRELLQSVKLIEVQSRYEQLFKVPFEGNIEQYYENKKKRMQQKESVN